MQGRRGEGLEEPRGWRRREEAFSFRRDMVAATIAGGEGLGGFGLRRRRRDGVGAFSVFERERFRFFGSIGQKVETLKRANKLNF